MPTKRRTKSRDYIATVITEPIPEVTSIAPPETTMQISLSVWVLITTNSISPEATFASEPTSSPDVGRTSFLVTVTLIPIVGFIILTTCLICFFRRRNQGKQNSKRWLKVKEKLQLSKSSVQRYILSPQELDGNHPPPRELRLDIHELPLEIGAAELGNPSLPPSLPLRPLPPLPRPP
ncbi:hypothetical protein B0T21DRAFT_359712 [Apiosordaria backusii]|uniref:Uncharacterized protein n=1 Tax=Apiosordaria backusii TaxID=314023 RepID=A0AA40ELP6_9PEZI|nr:hypothetical protein B0T21DRAFT_359712 [Apiosordaria backusii]